MPSHVSFPAPSAERPLDLLHTCAILHIEAGHRGSACDKRSPFDPLSPSLNKSRPSASPVPAFIGEPQFQKSPPRNLSRFRASVIECGSPLPLFAPLPIPPQSPYFAGIRASIKTSEALPRIVNWHNFLDFALGLWLPNQDTKPDFGYGFNYVDQLYHSDIGGIHFLTFPADTFEIYSHISESRSRPLGASVHGIYRTGGDIGKDYNLNTAQGYANSPWDHSAEFLSTYMRRHGFWSQLLTEFELTP
jgi:hypothetical protein